MTAIVALTNGSPHSWIILNAVAEHFGPITVLVEGKQGRRSLIRRRMKRHGLLGVAGQIGFGVLYRLLVKRSRARVAEILAASGLSTDRPSNCEVLPIGSVNSETCRSALRHLAPKVILVFGTRIIGRKTLESVNVPILNLHSGITPTYRGQAGGYWALAQRDRDRAGVTVHLVDSGVDTGDVLYQAPFHATRRDNFSTYFYLQAAALRPLAIQALEDALAGALKPYRPDLPSELHHLPTLWGYLRTGLAQGVW